MTTKHLSESTLNIRKVVRKEDIANRSLTNSIIEAIQCLINADSSNTEHVLLNIIISVAGVETEGEETEKVTKKKSKKRSIVECEEFGVNSSEPEIVNEERVKRKKSTKERPSIEADVETSESVKKCTPSEEPKTSRRDFPPANTKLDTNKSSANETRTSKSSCKRTNSESEQESDKRFKSSKKCEKTTTKNTPAESTCKRTEQQQESARKSTLSEECENTTTKNIPVEYICRRTEHEREYASSEKSKKTNTKNMPVENICRSTEQDQESASKSTSSVKSGKITTKNIPVVGIKINANKSSSNEIESSKNSSINSKKINSEQTKIDEECFKLLEELEDALKRRVKSRWTSETIMLEKFEYLKLLKKRKNIGKCQVRKHI